MADIRGEGSDTEGPFSPTRRGASNMSIHAGLDNSSYMDRPSMKQDDHPAHNMPKSEYDGSMPTLGALGMAR